MRDAALLLKRVKALLTAIEQQQRAHAPAYRVVIYDPITGLPLPGFDQPGSQGSIRIPDNGRDNYATFWLPAVQEYRA